ncbi:hypothetical protein AB1E18_013405 [Capra hircus]
MAGGPSIGARKSLFKRAGSCPLIQLSRQGGVGEGQRVHLSPLNVRALRRPGRAAAEFLPGSAGGGRGGDYAGPKESSRVDKPGLGPSLGRGGPDAWRRRGGKGRALLTVPSRAAAQGPFCSGMKLRTGSISGMLQPLQMTWLRGPVGCAEKENWGRDLEVFGEWVDEAPSVKIVGIISGEGSGVS